MNDWLLPLAITLGMGLSQAQAQHYGPQPSKQVQDEILRLRENAWRAWFDNDPASFRKAVPDELVAMGFSASNWPDREQTIKDMAEFAQGGKRIKSLEFPRNVFQDYGNVIVLYTRFKLVLRSANGDDQLLQGRGTEIFVKRDQRWIHTGWHLDTVVEEPMPVTK